MVSTYNPAKDIPSLEGKVFFITGGTAGLGAGAITNLAAHDPAHIYFTGRNAKRAEELIATINKKHPNVALTYLNCDMAQLSSVKACADKFLESATRLDILMCNAGIMGWDASTTADGYEVQFQVNHLAHALLIKLLLPILQKTANGGATDVRIVNLASQAYAQAPSGGIDFATLKTSQAKLGNPIVGYKWNRYGQSKLANLLYPVALAKRYPEITSVSVHPGFVRTELMTTMGLVDRVLLAIVGAGKFISVEQGPYSQLWAATVEKGKLTSGGYYEPVGLTVKTGGKYADDEALAEKLWDWTQEELKAWN